MTDQSVRDAIADIERCIDIDIPPSLTKLEVLLAEVRRLQGEVRILTAERTEPSAAVELLAGVKAAAVYALNRREAWANSSLDAAIPRAIAYQHMAGLLLRLLDDQPTDPHEWFHAALARCPDCPKGETSG